jgi:hypothetical protein
VLREDVTPKRAAKEWNWAVLDLAATSVCPRSPAARAARCRRLASGQPTLPDLGRRASIAPSDHSHVIFPPKQEPREGRWVAARRPKKGAGPGSVVELFAGVGGFRVASSAVVADGSGPTSGSRHQGAARRDCYRRHWDDGTLVNADIATVLGGFLNTISWSAGSLSRYYSVAKTLNQAPRDRRQEGRSLVVDLLDRRRPSPKVGHPRERRSLVEVTCRRNAAGTFAIILACLRPRLHGRVAVVNAAEYGFPRSGDGSSSSPPRSPRDEGQGAVLALRRGCTREGSPCCRLTTSTPNS